MIPTIRFVCATREAKEDFFRRTALGRSIEFYSSIGVPFELSLTERNSAGLPAVYNRAIRAAATSPAILIFVHDDLHLHDFGWPYHLLNGLQAFDIIGLAGNRRRVPRQPAWICIDETLRMDALENLSGCVAHGKGWPPTNVSYYGTPGVPVVLLDGLLIAVRSEVLLAHKLNFDERFDFHFYDMDFCREAEVRALRMGTCPIGVVHESTGSFGSAPWRAGWAKYLDKWGS